MSQIGGGVCSLCGSEGTNKTTCPLNSRARNPNPAKHPKTRMPGTPIPIPKTPTPAPKTPMRSPAPKTPIRSPAPKTPVLVPAIAEVKNLCSLGQIDTLPPAQLDALLSTHQPQHNLSNLTVQQKQQIICGNLCPGIARLTPAIDVTQDLEYKAHNARGDLAYFYKGKKAYVITINPLGAGTYGKVDIITVTDGNNVYKFVEKTSLNARKLEEAEAIVKYTEAVKCPGVVSMKIFGNRAIMPLADGDLKGIELSLNQSNNVISTIKVALKCMARDGAYYFDLKPANILYRCKNEWETEYYLGDMGSVIVNSYMEYTTTFPPPAFLSGFLKVDTRNPDADPRYIYSYQLSVLFCKLVTGYLLGPTYGLDKDQYRRALTGLAHLAINKIGSNPYSDLLLKVALDNSLVNILPLW